MGKNITLFSRKSLVVFGHAAGLKLKREKCQFGKSSAKFLGHVVSAQGTEPDPEKVKAAQDFPNLSK